MYKKPTIAERKQLMDAGWSKEDAVRGYTIAEFATIGGDGIGHFAGMKAIKSITEATDVEAAKQAVADGIKIIPVKELPENFDQKRFGWIDTPENRDAINAYCYPLVVEAEPEPVVEEEPEAEPAPGSQAEFEFTDEPVEKYFEE